MNLTEERNLENVFYEKVKEVWLDDKTKKNMEWLAARIDRLNVVDQRIMIEEEIKLSEEVASLVILYEANSPLYADKTTQFYKNHIKSSQ
jgi:hypothetical protein